MADVNSWFHYTLLLCAIKTDVEGNKTLMGLMLTLDFIGFIISRHHRYGSSANPFSYQQTYAGGQSCGRYWFYATERHLFFSIDQRLL